MKTHYSNENIMIPLNMEYEHDEKISLNNESLDTSDGYQFVFSPIFQNVKNCSSNKQTNFYLTSSYLLTDFISDYSNELKITETGMLYDTISSIYMTASSDNIVFNRTDDSGLTLFKFEPIDSYYKIRYWDDRLFTVDLNEPYLVTLQDEIENDLSGQQIFNLLLSGENTTGADITAAIQSMYTSGYFHYNTDTLAVYVTSDLQTFELQNFHGVYNINGYNPDRGNDWVVYYNSLSTPALNKSVDINTTRSLSGMPQNYLVSLPYETKISNGVAKIDFTGLKNMQTIESEYSYVPVITNSAVSLDITNPVNLKLREYDKIFTGTNQYEGYENVHLGYTTEFAKVVKFEPDKTTYFHYPNVASQIPLSSAGIEYVGAMYGTSPIRSDRIYKKMANYKKNIHWGNSLQWQNGEWLCSWLSGAADGSQEPKWMDRWYYPGYTTQKDALTSVNTVICLPSAYSDEIYVWDIPTQMTFDPGVWYKYAHMGNNTNQFIVDSLKGQDNNSLKLHYDKWDSSIITDLSENENDGVCSPAWSEKMVGELDIDHNITNVAFNLLGNNEIVTPYDESYNPTHDYSVGFWAYTEDWNNAKSAPFVGNYFRGGWKMGFTNNFNNPFMFFSEKTYGHIITSTIQRKFINDTLLPKANNNFGTPVALVTDTNYYAYILDSESNSLYKMDYIGNILNKVNFGSEDLLEHLELVFYNDEDVVYVSTTNNSFSAFDTNCLELVISGGTGTTPISSFTIDLSGDYIYHETAKKIIIDNSNNVWSLYDNKVEKNDTLVFADWTTYTDINCDKDNNIWLVDDNNKNVRIVKMNNNGRILMIVETPISSNKTATIHFAHEWIGEPDDPCNIIPGQPFNTYLTFAYICDAYNNKIYKITEDGYQMASIFPLNYIDVYKHVAHNQADMQFHIHGDFSGYDYHRKYFHGLNNQEPQLYLQYDYFNNTLSHPKTKRLFFPTKDLVRTWHHIAFSFDYGNSIATMYINSEPVHIVNHDVGTYIYQKHNTPLVIGKHTGLLNSFDSEIDLHDYGTVGEIADLRIYDNVINQSDFKHIYLSKFDFTTLSWPVPTNKQSILEEIERFFKHKLPGMKSQYYNITITGLKIEDEDTKQLIEQIIRDTSEKVSPAYTELYNINWE